MSWLSFFGVMRQILGEALVQTAIGLALGLGSSLLLMQGIRTILFGVEPTDPLTLVLVGLSLLSVAPLAVASRHGGPCASIQ